MIKQHEWNNNRHRLAQADQAQQAQQADPVSTLASLKKSGGDWTEPVENIPREIHDLLCFLQNGRKENEEQRENMLRGVTMDGQGRWTPPP